MDEKNGEEVIYCSPTFQILNKGKGVSLHHKIILHFSREHRASFSYDVLRSSIKGSESLLDENTYLLTIYDNTPIFPDEIVGIGRFDICFPKSFISQNSKEEYGSEIKVEIVYDGGRDNLNLYVNDFYPLQFIEKHL